MTLRSKLAKLERQAAARRAELSAELARLARAYPTCGPADWQRLAALSGGTSGSSFEPAVRWKQLFAEGYAKVKAMSDDELLGLISEGG